MAMCKLYRKFGIVTIHGDLYRFKSKIKNWLDRKTIQIADRPITLNDRSLSIALKINPNSEMISSFIPPIYTNEKLDLTHIEHIKQMKKKYTLLFCTNASNLSYDKNENEIYGITELIEFFSTHTQFGLIFSDPSSAYRNSFRECNFDIPENVYVISGDHSFYKVMEISDASIRNTTTDGDSISVKESLYLNKITFATNVVSRPKGCILYNKGQLKEILAYLQKEHTGHTVKVENGYIRLKEIYLNT
jgi:hypothetical protein